MHRPHRQAVLDMAAGLVLRCLIVVGLVCVIETRCASAPTTKQAEAAVADIEDMEGWIDQSNLSPETKAAAHEKATNVKTVVVQQGQALIKKDAEIVSLKGYKKLVIGFCVAAGLAILGGGYLGIRWFIKRRAAALIPTT